MLGRGSSPPAANNTSYSWAGRSNPGPSSSEAALSRCYPPVAAQNRRNRFAALPLAATCLGRVGGDRELLDLVRARHGPAATAAALDLVDQFHAFHDLTPDRVLAVQVRGWLEHDEELAVRAVRALRARHAAGAAHELRLVAEL